MRVKRVYISGGGSRNATPFNSPLDVVRDLLGKGVGLKSAIKEAEKTRNYPLTSKELEDARNLTKHNPVVYIKPRIEPTGG